MKKRNIMRSVPAALVLVCGVSAGFAHNGPGTCKTDFANECKGTESCTVSVNGNNVSGNCSTYQYGSGADEMFGCDCT